MHSAKSEIIHHAQVMIQKYGFNDFSFRDIAEKVGIKSSSIHYHFPTKADLGRAVAENYRQQFLAELHQAETENDDPVKLLEFFTSQFRRTLLDGHKMCLCGMLSAESQSLPESMTEVIRSFFNDCINWLSALLKRQKDTHNLVYQADSETEAKLFIASLEGGLIIAKGLGDVNVFDKISDVALKKYQRHGSS